ncbi:unnamed protein product [Staurois parvus]|uniref:Uncharacterized protein n=1 Tax=Staurois parvus TaxID=386267 RepID=A0ABN9HJW6_9NEOB|nr:unnamed protein product [Staurois parvus]
MNKWKMQFITIHKTIGYRGGLTIWKFGHCLRAQGSVGGPMRCPWYLFHRFF